MNIIFDIETKPNPTALNNLLAQEEAFDPSGVAVRNLVDQSKIDKKIADAKQLHEKKMEEWRAKQKKVCCLDSDLGQISAIGIKFVETGSFHIIDGTNEHGALTEWWSICESSIRKGNLVLGWNTDGFDLPFLFGRSRLLGVKYDHTLITNYRYFHKGFVDLHKVWTFGAYGKFCKLEKAYEALGYKKPPLEVHGGSFHEFWDKGGDERVKATAYLKNDLEMTFCVAKATHGLEVVEGGKSWEF